MIGIDAPDFNLGLESRLREQGIPTVHYVSPTVWAWRPRRVNKIRRAADKVLCLLPFEKEFYDRHGVDADFVGHPMAERFAEVPDKQAARQALGLRDGHVVAVLPGSRRGEVQRLGPVFAEACSLLVRDQRLESIGFVAPMASSEIKERFLEQIEARGLAGRCRLLDGQSELALTSADAALVASGTATLEAALLCTPIVAAYRVAPLTATIARWFKLLKAPFITLPNFLTEKPMVPEFVQEEASPDALAAAVAELLLDERRRNEVIEVFSELRGKLAQNADQRAADAIQKMLTEMAA